MTTTDPELNKIKARIIALACDFGFQDARVSDCNTGEYFERYERWIKDNYHGNMSYLERNKNLRQSPAELHPNTLRVISFRYNYLPEDALFAKTLEDSNQANISRYALGRDYHKLLRKKLTHLCSRLTEELEDHFELDYRVFVDSAPVLETAFAEKSGLGWKGKHTLIINKDAGSWFFLAEIFINLALPIDKPVEDLCGNCTACISLCPTNAIIGPKKIDATRCISYLTIENKEQIPLNLRPLMGNHVYGCDDCQLACPWNRYSQQTKEIDFLARNSLNNIALLELWAWTEKEFLNRFEGSPVRRIGYQSWLRNLAVAIGNSDLALHAIELLNEKKSIANDMVIEHIDWAIEQLKNKQSSVQQIQTTSEYKRKKKLINGIKAMFPRDA